MGWSTGMDGLMWCEFKKNISAVSVSMVNNSTDYQHVAPPSVPPALPDTESPENSDAEELLGKKQRLLPLVPPQDVSCVAARTRPVLGCRKRRLIRPAAGHKVGGAGLGH